MRLNICWFGMELDITFGPTAVDDEPEPEAAAELDRRGDALSTPLGFAPTPHPGWEKSLNGYDEPAEGDEDT